MKDKLFNKSMRLFMTKKELQKELAKANKENIKLKKKVGELEVKIDVLKRKSSDNTVFEFSEKKDIQSNSRKVKGEWNDKVKNHHRYSKRTWFGFFFSTITNSSLFSLIYKIARWIKKITFISTLAFIIKTVFAIVSTSAIFIFLLLGFVLLLPFILIGALVALIHTIFSFKKYNEMLRTEIRDKKVLIFLPDRDENINENSYFRRMIKDSSDKNTIVIFVTPLFFSSKGIGGKGAFLTCRQENKNTYIVRRRYFFIFKRKVLNDTPCEPILIY